MLVSANRRNAAPGARELGARLPDAGADGLPERIRRHAESALADAAAMAAAGSPRLGAPRLGAPRLGAPRLGALRARDAVWLNRLGQRLESPC